MWVGDLVAERFVIERPIGSGGMGSVFLATDRADGGSVALKVLDLGSADAIDRFRRETRVLSELAHPGIVRYVAHGDTAERRPFLAMELLEGEDLAEKLTKGPLRVDDSLSLIRRTAEALSFAHERGIVHRDVKPSNLFLVDSDVAQVKVLDFGIARARLETRGLTQTGAMLGTVGYMAPEQAMGSRDVDARADVFALGCVLFECLTGTPAFSGAHAVAILAKVLAEEAPKVSDLVPGLGESLDTLVARLLAKKPADRPADAAAVVRLLETPALAAVRTLSSPPSRAPTSLTHSEQRVVSVILAEPRDAGSAETITPDQAFVDVGAAREIAARFGAEFTPLQGGALLFVLSGGGAASDQAAAGASCALEILRATPEHRVALATGRAETTARLPVGAAIDRAAALLRDSVSGGEVGVRIDDVTAGLVEARFDLQTRAAQRFLSRERTDLEAPRRLMGKPTPTVGRERELGMLELTLAECLAETVARAVVVIGPPGMGKSRLGAEFISKVRGRGDVRVLLARAEAVSAGTPFLVAQRLARNAIGLRPGEAGSAHHGRVRTYVRGLPSANASDRLREIIGELAGIPTDEAPSSALVSARNDPVVMADQKRRAFHELLDGETGRAPLVIVLEDLHWGDAASFKALGDALRRLADRAFLVVALARPEVHEQFPRLWDAAAPQEIRLSPLGRRAAERLLAAVLGERLSPETVARIVDRAEGNAFYLEELIRQADAGETGLPESVLAMALTRVERLEPEVRRVLRAASVFGEAFWEGGVEALLGPATAPGAWLEALVDRELIAESPESRFPLEREFAFRHALLRDAAYATLTEADRVTGHRLAGEWLEERGEANPTILADHFERGGVLERAVPSIVRLAQGAVMGAGGDPFAAIERGVRCGASGEYLGALREVESYAGIGLQDWDLVARGAGAAVDLLPVGSALWMRAVGSLLVLDRPESVALGVRALCRLERDLEPTGPCAQAMLNVFGGLNVAGRGDLIPSLIARLDKAAAQTGQQADVVFETFRRLTLMLFEIWNENLGAALQHGQRAVELARGGPAKLAEAFAPLFHAFVLLEVGAFDEVLAISREAVARAHRTRIRLQSDHAHALAAAAHARAGACEPARAEARAVSSSAHYGYRALAEVALAEAELRESELERALVPATVLTTGYSAERAQGFALLARIHLEEGDASAALDATNQAEDVSARVRPGLACTSSFRLTKARALLALGEAERGRWVLLEARERILRIAATLDDPTRRQSYLTRVLENAETLSLARAVLGESGI